MAGGLAAVLLYAPLASATPQLQASPPLSTDGVTQLSWDLKGSPVELQRATTPTFDDAIVVYRGTDSASLRSGLVDDDYYYRLRALAADGSVGPWSAPLQVQVRHHELGRAWGVFALGGVVFFATLGTILAGTRREESQ